MQYGTFIEITQKSQAQEFSLNHTLVTLVQYLPLYQPFMSNDCLKEPVFQLEVAHWQQDMISIVLKPE